MEEMQNLCDRMVIVQKGRINTDDSPQAIVGRTGIQHTTITADVDETTLRSLEASERGRRLRRAGRPITVDGGDGSPQAVLAHLAALGVCATGVRVDRPTLEDAYHRLTSAVVGPARADDGLAPPGAHHADPADRPDPADHPERADAEEA